MLHVYFVNTKESFHNNKKMTLKIVWYWKWIAKTIHFKIFDKVPKLATLDKLLRIQHSVRSHFVPKTISILSTKNNGSKVYRFFCNKESLRWFFKANESNTHDKFNLNGFASEKNWRVDIDILDSLFLLFWI